ncbi:MAG: hypothetical protein IKB23_06575, partial [Clostridia bacterium]|nr:hypothetical protein [Clostridia bacterium]
DHYTSTVWTGPPTRELSCSILTKGLARILTANCGIWWFDMFGGWLHDDALLSVISKAAPLLEEQKHSYLNSEVAVIIDETGYKYYGIDCNIMSDAVREVGASLSHAGITFDIYLQSDLKNKHFPTDRYKLYIFLGGVSPKEEDKRAIENKLKMGGRTLLWLHSASFYDSELCGFELENVSHEPRTAVYKGESYPSFPLPTLNFKSTDGYVMSRFEGGGEPAVIWRDMGEYASVYSLIMSPSAELFRDIALLSGVHIYNYKNDCIFAGGEFIAIHACDDGYKRLNLPEADFKATNALTGEDIKVNSMFIDIKMKKHDTVIIKLSK